MDQTLQLDPAEIDAALAGTPFQGGLHHFATIDSTNTHALEQAKSGAPHGSYFVADEQTAGRGRSDHQWHSNSGEGLYLSVLIRPQISVADLTWLPLLTGIAAYRAILDITSLDIDLRWPNDLLIGQNKVGGILVEALSQSNTIAAVIGIGINLRQQAFPPNLATPATSLDRETGHKTRRQQLLVTLLLELNEQLRALNDPAALAAVPDKISRISTWVQGKRVEVHGPQPCTGITEGLDTRGFLRVRTEKGVITITTGGIRAAE
jgi:BirA family biotin operon repressor/biotin-[acetyl-CoA-carboxylase] ligase